MIYSKIRERYWRKQGIKEPNGSGRFLTWETYQAVMKFQNNRCAVCEKVFFVADRGSDSCDHDHKTGLMRGICCSKRRGCNYRFIGKVERYPNMKIVAGSGEEAALRYLANPPAQQWIKHKAEAI